jgi:tRNA (cytidine/uridine-2'-O-)-methyltransferase
VNPALTEIIQPPCGLHVVLVEPEIPPNTGNIARLCRATGARLHLIEPLGFSLDEQALRRAGMDYWHECDVHCWPSWAAWRAAHDTLRCWFFTTKASRSHWGADYRKNDALIFGRESRGLPESLLHAHPEHCVRLPMVADSRSLNLATATGIALYEAWRGSLSAGS